MKERVDDLQGFYITRSSKATEGFKILNQNVLQKNTQEYIDDILGETESYYAVAAVDTAGNLSFSPVVMAVLIDTIPPSVPKNLTGSIDTAGVVTLRWDLGPEKNIIGYRVLRANDPNHEFVQLTGKIHADTVFSDTITIKTLTRHVYYKIAAVNNRYQHSALTPYLELERPDKIPPVEAVFYDVFVSDSCVNLKWNNSTSDDVAQQLLYRQSDDEKEWMLLKTLAPSVSFYSDKEVETAVRYHYTIVTVDGSGLKSQGASPVSGRPYDTGIRKGVENLNAAYNPESKLLTLNWDYEPEMKEKYWFVVYKSIAGSPYREYKAVSESERSYIDRFPSKGLSGYGIVLKTTRGGESEMLTVEVEIKNE
jgi:fibronectin type 3 domain-containing protein